MWKLDTRRELTIHLRSGDLLDLHHISSWSLMASCLLAFATHKALNTSQSRFEVIIQAGSKVEDACASVCAKRLVLGAMSTFSPSNDAEDVNAGDNTFLHSFAARWLSSYFLEPGLKVRAGEVLFLDELTGVGHKDLFLTSFPGPVFVHTGPR